MIPMRQSDVSRHHNYSNIYLSQHLNRSKSKINTQVQNLFPSQNDQSYSSPGFDYSPNKNLSQLKQTLQNNIVQNVPQSLIQHSRPMSLDTNQISPILTTQSRKALRSKAPQESSLASFMKVKHSSAGPPETVTRKSRKQLAQEMAAAAIINEGEDQTNGSRITKEHVVITDSMRKRQIELEEAQGELSKITVQQLREIRSFNFPPTIVKRVMEALMLLLGKDQSWASIRKVINDKEFLPSLYNFKIKTVPRRTMRKLRENYLNEFYFQPYIVEKVSKPCTAICSWIICIQQYHELLYKQKQSKQQNAADKIVVPSNLQSDNEPIDIVLGLNDQKTYSDDQNQETIMSQNELNAEKDGFDLQTDENALLSKQEHEQQQTHIQETLSQPQDQQDINQAVEDTNYDKYEQINEDQDNTHIKEQYLQKVMPNEEFDANKDVHTQYQHGELKKFNSVGNNSREDDLDPNSLQAANPFQIEQPSPLYSNKDIQNNQQLSDFVTLKNQGKFTGNGLDLNDFQSFSPLMMTYKLSARKRQKIATAKESETKQIGKQNPLNQQQQTANLNSQVKIISTSEKGKLIPKEKKVKGDRRPTTATKKKVPNNRFNRLYQEGTAKLRKVNLNDQIRKEEERIQMLGTLQMSPRPKSTAKDSHSLIQRDRSSMLKKAPLRSSTSVKNASKLSFVQKDDAQNLLFSEEKLRKKTDATDQIGKNNLQKDQNDTIAIDISGVVMNSIVERTSDLEKSNKSSCGQQQELDTEIMGQNQQNHSNSRYKKAQKMVEETLRPDQQPYNNREKIKASDDVRERISTSVKRGSSRYTMNSSKNPYLGISPTASVVEQKRQSEILSNLENSKKRSVIEVYRPSSNKIKSRQKITSPMQNEESISIDIDGMMSHKKSKLEPHAVQNVIKAELEHNVDESKELNQQQHKDQPVEVQDFRDIIFKLENKTNSDKDLADGSQYEKDQENTQKDEEPTGINEGDIDIEFEQKSGFGPDIDPAPMVDMFNENNLFYSDIDTCRSKEVTILDDIAQQVQQTQELDIATIDHIEPPQIIPLKINPAPFQHDINDQIQPAFQSQRHKKLISGDNDSYTKPEVIQTDRVAETAKFNDIEDSATQLSFQKSSPQSTNFKNSVKFIDHSFGMGSQKDLNQSQRTLPKVTSIQSVSESMQTERQQNASMNLAPILDENIQSDSVTQETVYQGEEQNIDIHSPNIHSELAEEQRTTTSINIRNEEVDRNQDKVKQTLDQKIDLMGQNTDHIRHLESKPVEQNNHQPNLTQNSGAQKTQLEQDLQILTKEDEKYNNQDQPLQTIETVQGKFEQTQKSSQNLTETKEEQENNNQYLIQTKNNNIQVVSEPFLLEKMIDSKRENANQNDTKQDNLNESQINQSNGLTQQENLIKIEQQVMLNDPYQDSDDFEETVEVRMGLDSTSRENSVENLDSAEREFQLTTDNNQQSWAEKQIRVQEQDDSDNESGDEIEQIHIDEQQQLTSEDPEMEYIEWKQQFQDHFCDKAKLYCLRDPVEEKTCEQTINQLTHQFQEKSILAEKMTEIAVKELEQIDKLEFEQLMSIDDPSSTILKVFYCIGLILGIQQPQVHQKQKKGKNQNAQMIANFSLIKDHVENDVNKISDLLLEQFEIEDVDYAKFEQAKAMIGDRDMWEETVQQTSPALTPIRSWIFSAIENIEIQLLQSEISEFKKKLQLMREPFIKHLDSESICKDSQILEAFIAGLAKIITIEVGEVGKAFDVLLFNDIETEEHKTDFGSLLASYLSVPLQKITDAKLIKGDFFLQEFEDASEQIKQMGIAKDALQPGLKVLLIDNLFQDPVIIQSADHLIQNFENVKLIGCFCPFEVDNKDIKEVKSLIPCKFVSAVKLIELDDDVIMEQ